MALELTLNGRASRLVDGWRRGIPERGEYKVFKKYERKEHNQGALKASEDCWDKLNKGGNQAEKQAGIIL